MTFIVQYADVACLLLFTEETHEGRAIMGVQVGAVMVFGTVISILIVDGHILKTVGRRALLTAGGVVMFLSEACLLVDDCNYHDTQVTPCIEGCASGRSVPWLRAQRYASLLVQAHAGCLHILPYAANCSCVGGSGYYTRSGAARQRHTVQRSCAAHHCHGVLFRLWFCLVSAHTSWLPFYRSYENCPSFVSSQCCYVCFTSGQGTDANPHAHSQMCSYT